MPSHQLEEVTGSDIGYSGEDQIEIMLHKIVELGGTAQMQDLYAAMEAVLNPQGYTLSFQGKSSVRFFTNEVAVKRGYLYPHDRENPGWRITPKGLARIQASLAMPEGPEETAGRPDEPTVIEHVDRSPQEPVESEAVEPLDDYLPEPIQIEGLLTYIDQVLESLPEVSNQHLLDPDGTTLFREGSPGEIQATVRALMGFARPGEVLLKLTLNSDGWYIVLDIHPRQP